MAVTVYDPGRIIVTLGEFRLTGFADGTFVAAERNTDTFSMKVGADGEVTRGRSRDRTGTITLTLLGSSPSNDFLSSLIKEDEKFGTGARPLQIVDLEGTTLVNAPVCWVKKPARYEAGKELSDREWTLDCAELSPDIGGNNELA